MQNNNYKICYKFYKSKDTCNSPIYIPPRCITHWIDHSCRALYDPPMTPVPSLPRSGNHKHHHSKLCSSQSFANLYNCTIHVCIPKQLFCRFLNFPKIKLYSVCSSETYSFSLTFWSRNNSILFFEAVVHSFSMVWTYTAYLSILLLWWVFESCPSILSPVMLYEHSHPHLPKHMSKMSSGFYSME